MPDITDQATKFSEQVENIIRIIKHGKREQVLFLIGFFCLGTAYLFPDTLKKVKYIQYFSEQVLPWLNVVAIVYVLPLIACTEYANA